MLLCAKLKGLRQLAEPVQLGNLRIFRLFFSVSDGPDRACVVHGSGETFEAAWQQGVDLLQAEMARHALEGRWLRLDWADGIEATTFGTFRKHLAGTKRNYFRHGLALDMAFRHAFLNEELNANAMLYGGNSVEHAVLNEKNIARYASKKYGNELKLDFSDENPVYIFSTSGLFCDEQGRFYELFGSGPDGGRRRTTRLSVDDTSSLIRAGSDFLASQVSGNGRFVYGLHPCFDRQIPTYNTLRHASSVYAMIEAWEVTRDVHLKQAIDHALGHLQGELIRDVTLPDGTAASFLIEVNGEIKLGGNAVAILALTQYSKATGDTSVLPLLERLALGICFMQNQKTGAFVHVLLAEDLSVKAPFRTIYYEGEAAFALMRLHELTGDPRWLATVELAFDHFIAQNHWRHHDHWLSYCVNELTRYRPQERYFRFGIRNVADYLDFVATRTTTFPTLLELMMAAKDMLLRIGERPELHHLLREIDLEKFRSALRFRAHHLLNGHFWPEFAMFFRAPEKILGSFFIRHHAFRVRIDDVEHYLSGFVAYRRHLLAEGDLDRLVKEQTRSKAETAANRWTAAAVASATGGIWITPPPKGWTATGLCTYRPAMKAGNMVVARPLDRAVGIPPHVVRRMEPQPAAIIVEDREQVAGAPHPILEVGDAGEAILALGRYARNQFSGKVLAVTGSAGKTTTVAMLAHVLSGWGTTAKTAHNANLPNGVGWNLASIPWNTPHVVLELAIGRMPQSSRMARPHVAMITNILPAHLGTGSTLNAIARTKSAIFRGMAPGGVAILNRDMMEWRTAYDAARAKGLVILHYGTHEDCEFRLMHYAPEDQRVTARIKGKEITFPIRSAGMHMAMNSLAVLAAVSALGYLPGQALERLASFQALPGRGEKFALEIDGRHLTVIDDAYNANPGSMRAAVERLAQERNGKRRVAVLGQMADLGPDGPSYHTELASLLADHPIDRYYVLGDHYAGFWQALPEDRKGRYADSLDELKVILRKELADGDVVLFKGSNSTRIHELVGWIKLLAERRSKAVTASTGTVAAPVRSVSS